MGLTSSCTDFLSVYAKDSGCVLVANAPSPKGAIDNYFRCVGSKIIIALDGAFDVLQAHGIQPHYVLGDLDSIQTATPGSDRDRRKVAQSALQRTRFVPVTNQNYTDLEKGLAFAYTRGASSIDIINAMEGAVDHSLGNVGILSKRHNPRVPVTLWHDRHSMRFVRGPVHLRTACRVGASWTALGAPSGRIVYTSGLQWNIEAGCDHPGGLSLSFLTGSLRNIVSHPIVEVVAEGAVLLIEPRWMGDNPLVPK